MEKKKTTILIIMDGWGIADPKQKGNAITPQTAPNYFNWLKKFPNTKLQASGEAVGLFRGQEGNSEAGHMNMGAGRVVKQDALYITDAIKDRTFFKNNAFSQAVFHIKKYNSAAHLMGLLSNHNSAHSCPEHIYALLDYFREQGIKKVFLHLFTDGRDSGQHDAPHHLKKLEQHLYGNERIATVMGRFYAMDRNKDWERTRRAFEAIVAGRGICSATSASEAIIQAYNRGETDEFICPTTIKNDSQPIATVNNHDAVFFFNLRSDRTRQLTKAMVQPNFEKNNNGHAFKRVKIPKCIRFVAMTDFGPDLPHVLTAFPSRDIKNTLPVALCPRHQLYMAESEKYAHVTYFFNGGYAEHFCNEYWVKVKSVEVDSYASAPEMSAKVITDLVVRAIKRSDFDFICVNFANPDMVGHTGDFEAGKIAVKAVDRGVEKIIKALLHSGGEGIITADHGNVEEMINLKTGEIDTEHSVNPVPFILIGKPYKDVRLKKGKLADIAPTILKMMKVDKPKEMTGKPLF